jgi:ribonuclease T1
VKWLLCLALLFTGPALGGLAEGSTSAVEVADLPAEARATLQRIAHGGPFPYPQDGRVFHNREKRLPLERRGYYREYTVATPGSGDRGARRIVAGRGGEYYYTADHYRTFRRIRMDKP